MKTSEVAGIVLTVIILIIGGWWILGKYEKYEESQKMVNVPLEVTVTSNHIIFTVEYKLYFDDKEVKSGSIGPAGKIIYTENIELKKSLGYKTMTVKVITTGGGFGDNMDSQIVHIGPNDIIKKVSLRA